MQSLSKTKRNNVESWIAQNYCLEEKLTSEEKYNVIYKQELKVDKNLNFEHDDKENTIENGPKITKSQPSKESLNAPKVEEEQSIPITLVLECKQTEIWIPFSKVTDPLLRPQVFRHHQIKLEESENNQEYNITEDFCCPPSPHEEEIKEIHRKSGKWIRQSSLKPRFQRCRRDTESEFALCRLCPNKKWIPILWFEQHMALAHGILAFKDYTESVTTVALPEPKGLFCIHQTKNFKRYYCQCPNCREWIRLGFPELVRTFPKSAHKPRLTIGYKQRINSGLYTNYFIHWMRCLSQKDMHAFLAQQC